MTTILWAALAALAASALAFWALGKAIWGNRKSGEKDW